MNNDIKANFTNKTKLAEMSLIDIAKTYGSGPLLEEEFNKRSTEEKIAYYKEFITLGDDNRSTINDIAKKIGISPIEVIDKLYFYSEIKTSDLSLLEGTTWLNYLNIIQKVPLDFLKEKLYFLSNNNEISNYHLALDYFLNNAPSNKIKEVIGYLHSNFREIMYICSNEKCLTLFNNEPDYFLNTVMNYNSDYIKKFLEQVKPDNFTDSIISSLINRLPELDRIDLLFKNNNLYNIYKNNYLPTLDPSIFKSQVLAYLKTKSDIKNITASLLYQDLSKANFDIMSLIKQDIHGIDITNIKESELMNLLVAKEFQDYLMHQENMANILNTKINTIPNFTILFRVFAANPEFLNAFIHNKGSVPLINKLNSIKANTDLELLNKYPSIEASFVNAEDFLTFLKTEDENIVFKYITLINKYHIPNKTATLMNNNFAILSSLDESLSYGNTSLNPLMLHSDFINKITPRYLVGILQFNTDASKIVVKLYEEGKLDNLVKYLDFLTNNISNNNRMLHTYILNYDKCQNLVSDIINNNIKLETHDLELLKEIFFNKNLYNIQSYQDLKNYFNIKAKTILTKEELNDRDILELFLNISSLNGYPLSFNGTISPPSKLHLEYLKYKYVSTGIISLAEYEYLEKIFDILNKDITASYDKAKIMELVNETINQSPPTIRSLSEKIRSAKQKQMNEELLDLESLRKIASRTDPNASVYYEVIDGQEYFHLNGYNYCFLSHGINPVPFDSKKSTATYSDSSANAEAFQNYITFSEKLKAKYGYNYSDVNVGKSLIEDPENWNLYQAVSTISTGINSPLAGYYAGYIYSTLPVYSWGKNSNMAFCGTDRGDAGVSHTLRNVTPGGNANLSVAPFYGQNRGEVWFDRFNEDNTRVTPEFIATNINSSQAVSQETTRAAEYFKCPIVVVHQDKYLGKEKLAEKMDLEERKAFGETLDTEKVKHIILNFTNDDDHEKLNFFLMILKEACQKGRINQEEYLSKLVALKWQFYECGLDNIALELDTMLTKATSTLDLEESSPKLGKINLLFLFLILIFTIGIGILLAIFLSK